MFNGPGWYEVTLFQQEKHLIRIDDAESHEYIIAVSPTVAYLLQQQNSFLHD